MKQQQLTYFRVVALVMAGIVASLAFGNLFTIVTKGVSVTLPTEEDVQWSIDPVQKEILFRTTFSVNNQGVYDINDINICAKLTKEDNTPLFIYEKQNLVVLHGTNTTYDLLIPFNLDTISIYDWFSLLYKNTTLRLLLDIDASYMFGLIKFTANEVIDIPWSEPPLNFSNNDTVQIGIQGLKTLLNISQNKSICSLSDIFSLFSLPQINYTSDSGFLFFLNISSYSETVINITCHIITPLFVIDASLEFSVSILVGIEGNNPVFHIQEATLQYVN